MSEYSLQESTTRFVVHLHSIVVKNLTEGAKYDVVLCRSDGQGGMGMAAAPFIALGMTQSTKGQSKNVILFDEVCIFYLKCFLFTLIDKLICCELTVKGGNAAWGSQN